uniref:Uncharacterized protein n=1 Tax=Anguilla anguilla TaxID=7936 RepID=A0A0E9RTY3_ANGAN
MYVFNLMSKKEQCSVSHR